MGERLYGAKCHRCSHLVHRGEQAVEPIPWLHRSGLFCDDCSFCQSDALVRMVADAGLDMFDGTVREAVQALHRGEQHPGLDRLRTECLALGATVSVADQSWFVADAQFDDGETPHLHLTLTALAPLSAPESGERP